MFKTLPKDASVLRSNTIIASPTYNNQSCDDIFGLNDNYSSVPSFVMRVAV